MDALQIIKMGKVAVRNSATAYPIYQNLFKEAFGFIPECPNCGSVIGHRHWQQFEAYAKGAEPLSLIQNNTIMSKTSFEIKNKSKIYSYQFEKNGRTLTARIYGDVMTEEFAKTYLESAQGDEELLAKRSAEFKTLPKGFGKTAGTTDSTGSIYPGKLADKKAYAAEQGYPEEEYKSIRSNADMEAYLDEKASEPDTVDTDPVDADPADVSEDLS